MTLESSLDTDRAASSSPARDRIYGSGFRARRLAPFLALADAVLAGQAVCRVLDIGGETAYWESLRHVWAPRRLDITIVNLIHETRPARGYTYLEGDARDLHGLADASYDIVHSNSVIEHVGRWTDMRAMAGEVRRLARTYFVQTPNYWFPVEPHLRTPFIHWLPRPWQRRIVMARACGFFPRAPSFDDAHRFIDDSRLVDASEMAALFPDARIIKERVGPLCKSLVAVRGLPNG